MSKWKYLDITHCPKCKGDVEVNENNKVRCVTCKIRGEYKSNEATYTNHVQWFLKKLKNKKLADDERCVSPVQTM